MPRYKESWKAADVLCPFFIGDDTKSLTCEGFAAKVKLRTDFASTAKKAEHMGTYCAGRYEMCGIYQLAIEKYE